MSSHRILLYPFIVLSAIGLVASSLVHISALCGIDLAMGHSFILHFGIFIVWIPTVLVATQTTLNCKRRDFWKAALRGCPEWMKKITYGFSIYAFFNFAIFLYLLSGKPPEDVANSVELRGFSGHWMAFYSAALAVLYSAINIKDLDANKKCLNGHTVSPLARHCEQCGAPIEGMSG
jgi:hypothetical protein